MKLDRNTIRFMSELNKTLDENYQKLSDKYKNLELSHNRKKKALSKILELCRKHVEYVSSLEIGDLCADLNYSLIEELCEDALFCDGREKYRLKGEKNETSKNETE